MNGRAEHRKAWPVAPLPGLRIRRPAAACRTWRDRPERLALRKPDEPSRLTIHLWGSFSTAGQGEHLSCHGDLLDHGAIGLADDDAMVPQALLERGLLLAEMQSAPVLLAPRDPDLQADGLAREGVETLRAGWAPDPASSELLPLTQLLALQRQHPQRNLRLMNISTAEAVSQLRGEARPPMASVSWWHLIADSGSMQNDNPGWCVRPSIGSPADRLALQQAVLDGLITAVAVHAVPLDEEDMLLPGISVQLGWWPSPGVAASLEGADSRVWLDCPPAWQARALAHRH